MAAITMSRTLDSLPALRFVPRVVCLNDPRLMVDAFLLNLTSCPSSALILRILSSRSSFSGSQYSGL